MFGSTMALDFVVVFCLASAIAAVEETLMDTRTATAELGWTANPPSGWEEVSGYDENLNTIRTYQVCNVFEPNQNNWLLTTFINRRGAHRIYTEMRFTVRDCSSLPNVPGSCKETFNLYYYETDSIIATKKSAFWTEAPYLKVDTIAADESFSQVDFGGRLMKVNTEVRSFGPLTRNGFYLAFQDYGACMSLLSVRVFFKKCPSVVQNFAIFPETMTGAESTSLVIARGTCIPNAEEVDVPIKLYCNGDGEWMVPIGRCTCKAGYEAENNVACKACPAGMFKANQGVGTCAQCPTNSRSTSEASPICTCRNGYYRADFDPPEAACTKNVSPFQILAGELGSLAQAAETLGFCSGDRSSKMVAVPWRFTSPGLDFLSFQVERKVTGTILQNSCFCH
ncbi:ephrin type-B receptor 1 isoform X2 [Mauremys mutica]|uniref:ephrin type-B receptor 1 isoform X2 n=1 Tax=Mauremys mutica TaxID=74926 RepID=UPI001D16A763|nr:ephrin type-B receptor 1 isoform X2 [Mauremys mutica]